MDYPPPFLHTQGILRVTIVQILRLAPIEKVVYKLQEGMTLQSTELDPRKRVAVF